MSTQSIIRVPDSQIPKLITYYEEDVARLSKEVDESAAKHRLLEQQYLDAQMTLALLKGQIEQQVHNSNSNGRVNVDSLKLTSYPERGSWWDKIKWSLIDQQKILSARDIMDCIYIQEPLQRVGGKETDRRISINIFSTLSNKFKENDLGRHKVGADYKYGFRHWFTEDGQEVIPKYDDDKPNDINEKRLREFVRED